MFDVAVIGAGIIGSYTALRLSRLGLKVVLFEKDKTPGDTTVCAGGMHKSVIQLINPPDYLIERRLDKAVLSIDNKKYIWGTDNTCYMVQRKEIDRYYSNQARKEGVTLLTRATVNGVIPEDNKVIYGSDGALKTVYSKVIVFADGAHSLINKTFKGENRAKEDYLIGIEYDARVEGVDFNSVEMIVDSGLMATGYFWVFPKSDFVNIGLVSFDKSIKNYWAILNLFIEKKFGQQKTDILSKKGGVIPVALNSIIQRKNCLAVGDAAGMVNPVTAGGYVCGFTSSELAVKAIRGSFSNGIFNQGKLKKYSCYLFFDPKIFILRIIQMLFGFLKGFFDMTGRTAYPAMLKYYAFIVGIMLKTKRLKRNEQD